MTLYQLIDDADRLFRGEPSFDDVTFGLQRLLAVGLVEVSRNSAGELRLKATRAGFDVKARARGRGHAMRRFAVAVGAKPYPEGDNGDRSIGRFSDLTTADWNDMRERRDRVFQRR